MSYTLNLTAYKGSDWTVAIEVTDASNDLAFDVSEYDIDLEISGHGYIRRASSEDGKIDFPSPNVIRWKFTREDLSGLCAGKTYRIGCRMTTPGGSFVLFTGNLAFLDSGVSS